MVTIKECIILKAHPHLIRPTDITPGITAEEYVQRRKKLMDVLPDDSVVVSVAGSVKYASQSEWDV